MVHLRNWQNPRFTLSLTPVTWYGLLELAESYGWASTCRALMDATLAAQHAVDLSAPVFAPAGTYNGYPLGLDQGSSLITTEQALSLAEALEQAFLDYEPRRLPALYYHFPPPDPTLERPSIGAILETANFCRRGAFWLETLERLPLQKRR